MSVIAGALFRDGLRWEDFLDEIDMIEVDTEYPRGDWQGLDEHRVEQARYGIEHVASASARMPLSADDMVRIEGDFMTIMEAFGRANEARKCLWFVILAED